MILSSTMAVSIWDVMELLKGLWNPQLGVQWQPKDEDHQEQYW